MLDYRVGDLLLYSFDDFDGKGRIPCRVIEVNDNQAIAESEFEFIRVTIVSGFNEEMFTRVDPDTYKNLTKKFKQFLGRT